MQGNPFNYIYAHKSATLTISLLFVKGLLLLLFILSPIISKAQFSSGMQMSFGKNRVQYNHWFWNFYRFNEFDIYYYGEKDLSIFTAKTAIKEKEDIEKSLDFRMDGRIQFFVFNKLSDLKQSNIGLQPDEQYNTGGVTNIVGRKILLYFDGDHEKFKQQIRKGIAQIEVNELLYGGDIKDLLQNAAMLNLPEWYVQGLISYFSNKWNVTIDNRVRDGVLSGRYKKFNRLNGPDAIYAGHSIWKYIADTYGESAIANIVYMTRINKNTESGFLFVLGSPLKYLTAAWIEYYEKKYGNADSTRTLPLEKPIIKSKAKFIYSQLKISPDGKHVAYTTNQIGKYKIWMYEPERKKRKRIKKGGYKTIVQETDQSFPLLTWHPSGKLLTVIRERRGKIFLGNYNVDTKKYEESPLLNFEKVLDASYSDDGMNLVLSAVIKSQSDIYVYNLRTHTYEQLTKDFYDDFNPKFMARSRQIVFSSNRINDTLNIDKSDTLPANNNTNIFIYDYSTRSPILKRVTNTPMANESQPMPLDSANILFLSDNNGIVNRYKAQLDSAISFVDTVEHYRFVTTTKPVTDYSRNIISYDVNTKKNKYAETIYSKGKYTMHLSNLSEKIIPLALEELPNTEYQNSAVKLAARKEAGPDIVIQPDSVRLPKITNISVDQEDKPAVADSNAIDINNYVFQNDLPKSKKKKKKKAEKVEPVPIAHDSLSVKKDEFKLPKLRIYETAFSTNYIVTQLDNSLLNSAYQTYSGGGTYFNPPLNAFLKIGISDLLEDYRMSGGVRLSYNLKGNEYFFNYENLKKRLDKQLLFYQGGRELVYSDYISRIRTFEIKYVNKWPFSDISGVRGSASYRNDRTVFLSADKQTLMEPNITAHWGGLKAEYVFDNTINRGLNLNNGTRFKVFSELFKQIDKPKTTFVVLGLDLRNYLKIHREIIWANRLAASTSLGYEKLIYYMGGVDNEFLTGPQFDNSTNIDQSQNYAYQAIATNMRGFYQNIRNGNSFVVVNSELRVPIFRYLYSRPIKSDFIRNFQVIGFGDVGSAWNGISPYSSNNTVNSQVIPASPLVITLTTQRDPIIAGYGWGLRSRILGYFIRADWAWGVAEGVVRPRIFYLSMSLDF